MTNLIEAAVAPVKAEAFARAQQDAVALIDRLTAKLEEAGWDLDVAAPYPNSRTDGRNTYLAKKARRSLFEAITRSAQSSRSMRDPCIVVPAPDREAHFVNNAIDLAGQQYDAFVAKLVGKIGEVDSASLAGSHVWGHSVLTVTKGETVERWKTQQIVNQSKLGTLFNQWPSRKVK